MLEKLIQEFHQSGLLCRAIHGFPTRFVFVGNVFQRNFLCLDFFLTRFIETFTEDDFSIKHYEIKHEIASFIFLQKYWYLTKWINGNRRYDC